MAMGIVSDSEFEKELKNNRVEPTTDTKAQIKIIDKPGRKSNDVNIPESLRKEIGSTAIEDGREAAIDLAHQFGISASSVSAYTQGARSTSSYNERPDKPAIDFTKGKIASKAISKLSLALKHITPEKLEGAKAIDLSTIAKNMSAVIKNMEPEADASQNRGASAPQFVFYSPQFTKMENFEIINSKDDY